MTGSGKRNRFGIIWLLSLLAFSANAQSADSLQRQANASYRNQPAKALRLFDRAWRLALRQGKPDLAANIRVDEATVYYAMYDDYHRATLVCRAGLMLQPLADSTRFKLWASLGEMYHQRNRPDSLTYCWQRADALLMARPALEQEARTYVAAFWGNRGFASLNQGDYRMAERYFQKRLHLLKQRNNSHRQAIAENQFAYFYLKIGRFKRADSLFQASVQHYRAVDLTRGWLLVGLIEGQLKRQQTGSSELPMREARLIASKAGQDGTELLAYIHQLSGQYWWLKKQPQTAIRFFKQSLADCKQVAGSERIVWRNLLAMSRLAEQESNVPDALVLVQQALQAASVRFRSADLTLNPTAADFLNGPDLLEALCRKAYLLRLARGVPNHLLLANATYDRAFELNDLLQTTYSSELTKLFVQEKLRPAYREAVATAYTLYQQQPSPGTFATLIRRQEQGNAAVLHETLRALQNPYPGAPPRLLEDLHRAKTRLSAAKTAWAERGKLGTGQLVDAELVNAELAWSQVYQQIRVFVPEHPVRTNRLNSLQDQLDSQTAFLQYSLTADSVLLTVVTRKNSRVLKLPISVAELNQLASKLRYEVYRNPDPFQYTGHATARVLFDRLFGLIWADLRGLQRLVIVRDGPLHYLPLEVLETGLRPNDYLLRYMAITYAYSMSSFTETKSPLPTGKPSVLSMAPFAVTETSLATIRRWGYEPLAGSDDEVGSVASTQSIGSNAAKSMFMALLPRYQLIHLATHAEANNTDPGESFIAFYPDQASHKLYAHELGLLDLRHIRLAVLSACRTGGGELHAGEGLLSLSRAFASAGCPQVITSLWNAHDGTTTVLTRYFYQELQRGQPTDIALQQAKLRFLSEQAEGGAFSPPHFWAHLVLMGHHQPVFTEPLGWPVGWLVVTGAVLVFLFVYRAYQPSARVSASEFDTRISSGRPD